jgi:RNA polymerase sigma factor (sigma-70 family)
MMDIDEKKYWFDFIDGDLQALSILFSLYAKGLFSYGMKIYPDEELAKDCIQEVFIQLIRRRDKLKRDEINRGLVYRMLRNKIIDEIKLISRRKLADSRIQKNCVDFEADQERLHIGDEEEASRERLLSAALGHLSSHQKEAMFLKYSDGLTYEQISQVMGIHISSARTLIYRTLKQLKSELLGRRQD